MGKRVTVWLAVLVGLVIAGSVAAQQEPIIAWKIWYSDRLPITSRQMTWEAAPAQNVVVVTFYTARTYTVWTQDGYDEAGHPVNQRLVVENYLYQFTQQQYYWFGTVAMSGEIVYGGTDVRTAVPLPPDRIKTGTTLDDGADWHLIYDAAVEDRRVPQ